MENNFKMMIILFSIEACVSSKNNTTIYVCVGEDVTLPCPPADISKTVSWFRKNVSKNPIITLYQGLRGKDNHLPSNIAVDVTEEKGESNLTINNFTKADTGSYQCLHDKSLTSWVFYLIVKDHRQDNLGSQTNSKTMASTSNVSTYKTDLESGNICACRGNPYNCENTTSLSYVSEGTTGVFKSGERSDVNDDDVTNMMWWYVMCCGLVAAGFAIVSCKYSTLEKGRKGDSRPRKEIIVV
ncbi:uncharacterized protein LOC127705146 isoform X2 [Mytilus californianus]|uniref:uncharacterized protein LOC127705146 isoform X2 n=1 Tax=Mytilus californianus TaxID=6549 RepID=UPI0022475535|nr:uncharacterized protein LOC127705146 isoform X2 [Mytilus californianus]